MSRFTRRETIQLGAGALAGASLLGGAARAQIQTKDVAPPQWAIEDGASLRVLRPSKFVKGDEVLFMENTQKFIDQTGIQVRVDNESWEDLRPKTAVAANVGSGPDIVLAFSDDPHQYPEKLVDLSDLCGYLGEKYGGWYPLAERYGKGKEGNWIAMPIGAGGGKIVYRKSMLENVGYAEVPGDFDGLLELCRKLQAAGTPAGWAVGKAVGDGNGFAHWIVWAHGAAMVDENDNVIINSKETIAALKYVKELYSTFIPGTISWLDPSNNKAYLAGDLSLTANGISIYYAAKNSDDPALQAIAEDTYHANQPVGPVGKPTIAMLMVNCMVFKHSQYPNACKEYLRFMMEKEQYVPWQQAAIGYWSQSLQAYEANPVWTEDPKHTPYRDIIKNALWTGYQGSLGYASAAVYADYVMVDMVASVCADQATPEEAAAEAQRRAERYYKI